MALARDTRMDRRRRVLLDASAAEQAEGSKRDKNQAGQEGAGKKGAGYSQDVRQACGTRLVQFIPVRKRSFTALVIASVVLTTTLLLAHYLVYVTGQLPWYGHPLAVALDATHPHSLAAWLGSHLWMLCLGTTILTFQLRRHKLDDYRGEYRLWFWLVITCLIASIDSTTHITELFGQGLDRWAKINIGWSGKAVVLATLSTLIGMLGLRLCTELKTVPTSLVCWLLGLSCWAGSAALGQEMLRLDLAIQTRIWMRAGLWLMGLTSIWIAAVAYLRHVYMDAQRRFLARGLLARRASAIPLKERVRQSIPFIRGRNRNSNDLDDDQAEEPKRWSLLGLLRRKPKSEASEAETGRASKKAKAKPAAAVSTTAQTPTAQAQPTQQPARPVEPANRPQPSVAPQPSTATSNGRPVQQPQPVATQLVATQSSSVNASAGSPAKREPAATKDGGSETETKKRGLLSRIKFWPGKDVPEEEATEYQKLTREEKAEEKRKAAEERRLEREMAKADKAKEKEARAAQRAADKQAKRDARQAAAANGEPKEGVGKKLLKPVAAVGGMLKKLKLPSLSAFKLNPPDTDGSETEAAANNTLKPANPNAPLPGTSSKPVAGGPQLSQRNNANYDEEEDDEDDRNLSKADRKKMRKQNRAA